MKRASGVLLHISSLPGPYGIGCFGEEALEFAGVLRSAGCTYWQVLPFAQTGSSHSPYQSVSSFAGNELFIDPRGLYQLHLITGMDLAQAESSGSAYSVDFDAVRESRVHLLGKAFENMPPDMRAAVLDFRDGNDWLDDAALFSTIREHHNELPWWEWDTPALRQHDRIALDEIRILHEDRYLYHCFVQYLFFTQWLALKKKINELGVSVIGDIPIYVAADSADVWGHSELFQMNPDHSFSSVSGVPPDYFSAEGQCWGNPLYRWDAHATDGYAWWIKRLSISFQLYDTVRIDHFRAFYDYWSIPFGETTAINGVWEIGPRMDFFQQLALHFPNAPIIAEDLGEIDDDVRAFLTDTGFPGMRVLQFGFEPDMDSMHLPHNYPSDTVAYTGTHDNNTILGWLWDAEEKKRTFALAYCHYQADDWGRGGPDSHVCQSMIRLIWQSHADLVIVPVQDLLGYGKDTRMNIPGKPWGNWTYRMTKKDLESINTDWLLEMNRLYSRQMDGYVKYE